MPEELKKSTVTRAEHYEQTSKHRTNHLLVIGIDNYKNGIPKLNNAVRDANMFKEILLKQYQFEPKNVTTLFNSEASLKNIKRTFFNILKNLTEDDNLVFYYSGHGELKFYGKSKRGYWIPADAVLDEDYTYLPNEEINLLFKNSSAHHVFGIVDSCFSGALFFRNLSKANDRIRSFPSRWLLTAGREEVVIDGPEGENSPFARLLFTYLKNYPNDSFWVADLCNHVLKGMNYNEKNQTPRGEPLQGSAHSGGQFVFHKKGFIPKPEIILEAPIIVSPSATKEVSNRFEDSKIELPANLNSLKTYLRKLANQNLGEALIQFEKYLTKNSSKENDILMQQGSYNRNKDQQLNSLINESNAATTEARIRFALLSYIDDLEEEDVQF